VLLERSFDNWPKMAEHWPNLPLSPTAAVEAILSQRAPPTPAEDVATRESHLYKLACQFLGGSRLIKYPVSGRSEVHAAILAGVPYASLFFLLKTLRALEESDVVKVVGVSTRMLRRQRETPKKSMPANLASMTWLFAETLSKATDVFGTQERAEEWLAKPAMGLDHQRPIDLLQTVQGAGIVSVLLTRLDYSVYT
jgi:putative toxin-antitoxin system antitoxin component (TIGR02293 family)